jgi:cyanate lyase
MSITQKIIDLHNAHPDWTWPQIAAHTGISNDYVRAVMWRYNLAIKERERCAKIAEKWNAPRIAAAIRAGE